MSSSGLNLSCNDFWENVVLNHMWNETTNEPQNNLDIIFIANDGIMKAHKFMLKSSSKTIRDILQNNDPFPFEPLHISAPDFSVEVIRQSLKLFYTGSVDRLSRPQMKDIWEFANTQLKMDTNLQSEPMEVIKPSCTSLVDFAASSDSNELGILKEENTDVPVVLEQDLDDLDETLTEKTFELVTLSESEEEFDNDTTVEQIHQQECERGENVFNPLESFTYEGIDCSEDNFMPKKEEANFQNNLPDVKVVIERLSFEDFELAAVNHGMKKRINNAAKCKKSKIKGKAGPKSKMTTMRPGRNNKRKLDQTNGEDEEAKKRKKNLTAKKCRLNEETKLKLIEEEADVRKRVPPSDRTCTCWVNVQGSKFKGQKKRQRCHQCTNCLAPNCNECRFCCNKRFKKSCMQRVCLNPKLPRCPCFD